MIILVPDIGVAEKPVRSGVGCTFLLLGPRDLRTTLRHHGVVSMRDIRYAFLAEDGPVSVIAGRARGE
jgi:hypothetical protein